MKFIDPDWSLIHPGWWPVFEREMGKPYFETLAKRLEDARTKGAILYPPREQIYCAFKDCGPDEVRVVILGQDPYHGYGQAMGLSFSVPAGVKIPPSLRNIYREVSPGQAPHRVSGDLSDWSAQGVLLLNASLTVEDATPGAHAKWGWHFFTDAIISHLVTEQKGIVFMLWGKHAEAKSAMIDGGSHLVLTAPHPSPLSAHRGFLGCGHFEAANIWIRDRGEMPINW